MKKLVVPVIFFLFLPLVLGSYISISVTISSAQDSLHVKLEQKGDEAAYRIRVVPFFSQYFDCNGNIESEKLYPGDSLDGDFKITPKFKLNGMYPFVAKIIYHDANMYPFSIISYHPIEYGKTGQPEITGYMSDTIIEAGGQKNILVKIKNDGTEERKVKVKIYLPNELGTNEKEKDVLLQAGEEKKIDFTVISKSALPRSSYNVLVTLEYDKGMHYTTFVTGMVRIIEKKESISLLGSLVALFIALLLLFIYLKWSIKREKNESVSDNSHLK